MEHALKLGIGLFLVLSSLVYFVWKLAHYLSDDTHEAQEFKIIHWAPTIAIYLVGIYLIFRAISDITEDDEEDEEDNDGLNDDQLIKSAMENDSGDSDYEDYVESEDEAALNEMSQPMQAHNYKHQNDVRRRY